MQEQKTWNELNKNAYDELVLALTPHIMVSSENCTKDNNHLETNINKLIDENIKLKSHVKLL